MAEFNAGKVVADMDLDRDPFQEGLRLARAEGQAAVAKALKMQIKVQTEEVTRALAELEALKAAGGTEEEIRVKTEGVKEALTQLGELKLASQDEEKKIEVKVDGDKEAKGKIKAIGAEADHAGNLTRSAFGVNMRAELILLGAAFSGVGAILNPFVAEMIGLVDVVGTLGVGIGAFAAVAIPDFMAMRQAQDAVAKAQKKVDDAITKPEKLKALKELKTAEEALAGPLGKAADAWDRMTVSFNKLKAGTAGPVFGVMAQTFDLLAGILPKLQPLILAVATASSTAIRLWGQALNSAQFQHFLNFITQQIGPEIISLTKSMIGFAEGFGKLIMATQPLANVVLGQVSMLANGFKNLTGNPRFQAFIEQVTAQMPLFNKVLHDILTGLGNILLALEPALGPLLSFLDQLVLAIQSLATGGALSSVATLFGALLNLLSPLLPLIATLANQLLPPLAHFLTQVAIALEPVVKAFEGALLPVLPQIAQALDEMLQSLVPLLPDLTQLLVQALIPMVQLLPELVPAIQAFADVFALLTPALLPLLDGIVKLNQSLNGLNVVLGANLGKGFALLLAPIGLLVKAAGAVINFFSQGTRLGHDLAGAVGAVGGAFATAWNAISDFAGGIAHVFVGAFDAVIGFFKKLPGRMLDALKALPHLLYVGAQDAIAAFLFPFYFGIVESYRIGKTIVTAVVHFLIALPGRLASIGSATMHGFFHGLAVGVRAVESFFHALPGRIGRFLSNAGGWLVDAGARVMRGLRDGITTGAVAVWHFLEALPGRARGFFSSAGSWLVNAGKSLLRGLRDGAIDGAQAIFQWLRGLPTSLGNILGDLGSLLWNAGKALMMGLLNGIKAGLEAVKNFVSGIAGKLTDWKGPYDYDLKLLVDNGQAIMMGLNAGLMKEFTNVEKNVKRMGNNISDALNVDGTVSLRTTGGTSRSTADRDLDTAQHLQLLAAVESLHTDLLELPRPVGEHVGQHVAEYLAPVLDSQTDKASRLAVINKRKGA